MKIYAANREINSESTDGCCCFILEVSVYTASSSSIQLRVKISHVCFGLAIFSSGGTCGSGVQHNTMKLL